MRDTRSLDVCILAGGLGTRLAGVWDGPKCLVPVAGKPLLVRLLDKVITLRPQRIVLALSHRHEEIRRLLFSIKEAIPSTICFRICIQPAPTGTANALRDAFAVLGTDSVLVLNGDTLPLYDLGLLMYAASGVPEIPIAAAWHSWRYAGAAVFNPIGREWVKNSTCVDLDEIILPQAERLHMARGFIDIGTPEVFHRAQQLTEKDLS